MAKIGSAVPLEKGQRSLGAGQAELLDRAWVISSTRLRTGVIGRWRRYRWADQSCSPHCRLDHAGGSHHALAQHAH